MGTTPPPLPPPRRPSTARPWSKTTRRHRGARRTGRTQRGARHRGGEGLLPPRVDPSDEEAGALEGQGWNKGGAPPSYLLEERAIRLDVRVKVVDVCVCTGFMVRACVRACV